MKALRDALSDAMADDEFAEGMVRFTGIPNNFTDGATAQQELIETTQAFLDNQELIDDVQQRSFDKYVR